MGRLSVRVTLATGLVAGFLLLGTHGLSAAPGPSVPAKQLEGLSKYVASSTQALQQGDVRAAKQHYQRFDAGWGRVEDDIRAKSRDAYLKIERAMSHVKLKLVKPDKPDNASALVALMELRSTIDAVMPGMR